MDTKTTGTSSAMSIGDVIDVDGIMVGDTLKWLALLVDPENRICSSFNDCVILFYKCLFTRIWLYIPFLDLR